MAQSRRSQYKLVTILVMGREAGSVVDANLKLYAYGNLTVVDASVIPTIPSGPIHAAVLAITKIFAADIAPPRLA